MSAGPGVDERVIAELWERQAFDSAVLASLGLGVVYRGIPSDAGGPDYQEALLSTAEAELVRGDVEFHVCSSHWYAHGHDRNRAYNDVVLHVVWIDDAGATVRQDGELVPTVALHGQARLVSSVSRQGHLHEHPCISIYASLSYSGLYDAVIEAGTRRFQERSEHFATEIALRSPEEALYTALFEALGYASNRETFRALSEAVPFTWLQSVDPENWTEVLLDAARLGPPGAVTPPARLPSGAWRLTRLRPNNHPARRIAAIAGVLYSLGSHPVQMLAAASDSARRATELRRPFLVCSSGGAVIGKGRADEIVCSVLLPFLDGSGWSRNRAAVLYREYPSPPYNRWTRVMLQRFNTAGHEVRPRHAIEHQGIHHLYHRHCRYERSDGCPVCTSVR